MTHNFVIDESGESSLKIPKLKLTSNGSISSPAIRIIDDGVGFYRDPSRTTDFIYQGDGGGECWFVKQGNIINLVNGRTNLYTPDNVNAGASPLTSNWNIGRLTFTGVSVNAGIVLNDAIIINNSNINPITTLVTVHILNTTGNAAGSCLIISNITLSSGSISIQLVNPTGTNSGATQVSVLYRIWNHNL